MQSLCTHFANLPILHWRTFPNLNSLLRSSSSRRRLKHSIHPLSKLPAIRNQLYTRTPCAHHSKASHFHSRIRKLNHPIPCKNDQVKRKRRHLIPYTQNTLLQSHELHYIRHPPSILKITNPILELPKMVSLTFQTQS
jgi:hypothetical protein